jgi:hypothetical protein
MKLSLLSILLGVGVSVPQIYGLAKPAQFAAAARKFPRNLPAGIFLMLLGTAWFLWIVNAGANRGFHLVQALHDDRFRGGGNFVVRFHPGFSRGARPRGGAAVAGEIDGGHRASASGRHRRGSW